MIGLDISVDHYSAVITATDAYSTLQLEGTSVLVRVSIYGTRTYWCLFRLRNRFDFRASDNASSLRYISRANVNVYATSGRSLPKKASFSGEPNFPGHCNLTLARIVFS